MNQYPLAAGAMLGAVRVAAPLICEQEWAYIRVERLTGTRRLGTAQLPDGGFQEGCTTFPKAAGDSSQCPVIDHKVLLNSAFKQLRSEGVALNGNGLGPCGNSEGGYDAWNMAIGVVHWKDAQLAVERLAAMLNSYDLKGFVGVAVKGYSSVELKPSEGPSEIPESTPPPLCEPLPLVSEAQDVLSLDSLSPSMAALRLRYASHSGETPKLIHAQTSQARIYYFDDGPAEDHLWGLRLIVDSPQIPHPTAFWVHFRDNLEVKPLTMGKHPIYTHGLDIPALEHGARCRIDPAKNPQNTIHILQSDGQRSTGSWSGNIKLMPALYSEDAKPSGETFWLEKVDFKEIETRSPRR